MKEEIELGGLSLGEMLNEIANHDKIFIMYNQKGEPVSET